MFKNLLPKRSVNGKLQKKATSQTELLQSSSNEDIAFEKPSATGSDARIETGILRIQIAEKLDLYEKIIVKSIFLGK